MKTKFRITWQQLMVDTIDFEDHFGMTYKEFKKLPIEEQEAVELEVIDSIRDEIVIQVKNTMFLDND